MSPSIFSLLRCLCCLTWFAFSFHLPAAEARSKVEGYVGRDKDSQIATADFDNWLGSDVEFDAQLRLKEDVQKKKEKKEKALHEPVRSTAFTQNGTGHFEIPWKHGADADYEADPTLIWVSHPFGPSNGIFLWPRKVYSNAEYNSFTMISFKFLQQRTLIGKEDTKSAHPRTNWTGEIATEFFKGNFQEADRRIQDLVEIYAENTVEIAPGDKESNPKRLSGMIFAQNVFRWVGEIIIQRLKDERRDVGDEEIEQMRRWLDAGLRFTDRLNEAQGYIWRQLEICHLYMEFTNLASRPGRAAWPEGSTYISLNRSELAGADPETTRHALAGDLTKILDELQVESLQDALRDARPNLLRGSTEERQAAIILNEFFGEAKRGPTKSMAVQELPLSKWPVLSTALYLTSRKLSLSQQ